MRPIRTILGAAMLSCVVFLTLGIASGAGAQAETLHELAARQGTTTEWTAFKVISHGGNYSLTWTFPMVRDPVWIGAWFYDENNAFRGSFEYTTFTYQNSYHAQVNVTPGLIDEDETRDAYGFNVPITIGGPLPGTPEQAVTSKVIIWAVGALSEGYTWRLSAPADTELARRLNPDTNEMEIVSTTGTNAFVHLSKDFEGTANAGVQGSIPPNANAPYGIGPGARATVGGELTVATQQTLIGSMIPVGGAPLGDQANVFSVSGPGGFQQSCQESGCRFNEMTGPNALAPGAYTFSVTGAGAGVGPFGDVLLTGVDARLPE